MRLSRGFLGLVGPLFVYLSPHPADAQTSLRFSQPRGIVVARSKAVISSELVAKIDALPFRAGQNFAAGDTLIRFDCRRYQAEQKAAKAKLRARQGVLDTNLKLSARRAIGTAELEISRAEVDEARAEVEALSVRLSQCAIKAPFSGRVVELKINEYEMPQANAPLIQIVNDKDLEIELIVPSSWLPWMKPSLTFLFNIDETSKSYEAEVLRIGSVVDPISQTAKLTALFRDSISGILPGMSGSAEFRQAKSTLLHKSTWTKKP